MEQVIFYLNGLVWEYSDSRTTDIKTAPAGNYRRSIKGTEVAILGKNNIHSLFRTNTGYVEVTEIQKSETPGDNYIDIADFIGATDAFFASATGGGFIEGQVPTFADLPDATLNIGKVWYVEQGSGGFFSVLGIYKYPKGVYTPNASNVWELLPLNVKVAEDSLTLVNITNWAEWIGYSFDINAGDKIIYQGESFTNLTGTQTTDNPTLDTTNWGSYLDLASQISVAYKEGRQFYDFSQKALSQWTDEPTIAAIRNGRLLRSRVENGEAIGMVAGDIVKITGVNGIVPVVQLSQATNILDVKTTLGMVMHSIAPGGIGQLAVFDTVVGADTLGTQVNDLVYLSENVKGKFTTIEPKAPNYSLPVGFVSVVGGLGAGVISVRFSGYTGSDTSANLEGVLNGLATLEQSISFGDDGVNVYADIINNEVPADNLPVMFGDKRYMLNTTTGLGAAGAARINLILGTPEQPQLQYIYGHLNSGVIELAVETTYPVIDNGVLALVSVKDLATYQSDGVQVYQRTDNSVSTDIDKGLLRIILQRLRGAGALYLDGVDPTLTIDTGPSPDSVNLTTTIGRVFQLRLQSFTAQTGIEYWILNHPVDGLKRITDLNQIDVDALGNSLKTNGVRFGLTFIGGQNSENVLDKLYINLPNGSYSNDDDCITDVRKYQIASVPQESGLSTNAFRLCRVCLRYNVTSGGTYINILELAGQGNYKNEKRFPLGVGGGGGGSTAGQTLTSLHGEPATTGLYQGGGLVINGTTQVDVSSGSGQIVNFYTDYQAPIKTPVSWPAQTITIPNLGVDNSSYIYVDNTGTLQTQNTAPTEAEERANLFLGFTINNINTLQIVDVLEIPQVIGNIGHTVLDYFGFTGGALKGGAVFQTANTVLNGDMAILVAQLDFFLPNINWQVSKSDPNQKQYPETDPTSWFYVLQTGEIDDTGNTLIDPLFYDLLGTKTIVPNAGAGRRATIQYLWKLIDGTVVVMYGQTVYNDLETALLEFDEDVKSLVIPTYLEEFGIPLAAITITQGCIDLADSATANIRQLGNKLSGGGGSHTAFPYPPDYLTKLNVNQASTTTVTIQPGSCRDSTDSTNITSESVVTVDMTVLGFNGRDTGSAMNFVWAIFIISDSGGVNPVGGLFSLSETAPLLPSGYDTFRRVGWVKRRSSELLKFSSIGGGLDKTIMYDIAGDALQILSAGSATSFALVGTGDFVPPTARGVYLQLAFIADVSGDAMLIRVGGGIGTGVSDFFRTGGSHSASMAIAVFMNLNDEQQLEYKVDDPADLAFLNIRGYVDDLSSNY